MTSLIKAAIAATVLAAIVGCQPTEPRSCPRTTILGIASELTQFRPGGGEDVTDVAFQIELVGLTLECKASKEQIDTTVSLVMSAERGPAGQGYPSVSYFVAVIERATQRILDKQVYGGRIPIEDGQRRGVAVEEWVQLIPLPKGKAGKDYEIMVGFNLTPEQLDAARRRRAEQ